MISEIARGLHGSLWGRSRLVRELRAAALIPRASRQGFDLSHLSTYDENVIGPIQRDEAVLLFGLIRVLRPLTVVEFGFQVGQSAFNFLRALDAVHDTGTVPRDLFPSWHWLLDTEQNWVGDRYEGQPGEREFVNWLLDEHPEFSQLHLHSDRTLRHGLTLLQRNGKLARPE